MSDAKRGTVVSCTRRYFDLADVNNKLFRSRLASTDVDVAIGDEVLFEVSGAEVAIREMLPRRNYLIRSSGSKSKSLVANADHLLILCAPIPLFNTVFIDRILVAAHEQKIPCTIIVNKIDLAEELEKSQKLLDIYRSLDVPCIELSAKLNRGTEQVVSILEDPEVKICAIAGISGVGKSTLINQLVPEAFARTSNVSQRSGQGRQTTSQAIAHLYSIDKEGQTFLVDLPGIQNFGVAHLDDQKIEAGFSEFAPHRAECRFTNCRHVAEPDCAVKVALEDGRISKSRYASYLNMLEEIEQSRRY